MSRWFDPASARRLSLTFRNALRAVAHGLGAALPKHGDCAGQLIVRALVQTKHIDADSINFGPHKGGLAELHDAEEAVEALLRNGAFRRYSLQDWSLGVELSAYLCMPGDGESQEVDFQIQVRAHMGARALSCLFGRPGRKPNDALLERGDRGRRPDPWDGH